MAAPPPPNVAGPGKPPPLLDGHGFRPLLGPVYIQTSDIKGADTYQKLSVHLFFLSIPTSKIQLQRLKASKGEKWGGGVPSQPTRETGDVVISCAILCDFTRLLLHLTAAWKGEIHTFLYWLSIGLIFPVTFLSCRTPPI